MNVLLLLLASVVGGEDCSALSAGEAQIISETNDARVAAGLPMLVVDCRLMGRARRHACARGVRNAKWGHQ